MKVYIVSSDLEGVHGAFSTYGAAEKVVINDYEATKTRSIERGYEYEDYGLYTLWIEEFEVGE
jgi:hypothetical protein